MNFIGFVTIGILAVYCLYKEDYIGWERSRIKLYRTLQSLWNKVIQNWLKRCKWDFKKDGYVSVLHGSLWRWCREGIYSMKCSLVCMVYYHFSLLAFHDCNWRKGCALSKYVPRISRPWSLPVFCKIIFQTTAQVPSLSVFSLAIFVLKWQSCKLVAETIWSLKQVFAIWFFM